MFDTVESRPIAHRRDFIGGGAAGGGSGQRLVNVAVTRPQHKLVIIANHGHIVAQFAVDDTLRLAVDEAHTGGMLKSRSLFGAAAEGMRSRRPEGTATRSAQYRNTPNVSNPAVDAMEWLDDRTFFTRFLADLRAAQSSVVIFSPFVREGRTGQLVPELQATCANGVRVTVVASESTSEKSPVDAAAREALERAGVAFRTSPGMHEKVVLVDDRIVYFGSLNPLSQNGTTELMQRIESLLIAEQVARMVRIRERATPADWGEDFVIPLRALPDGEPCPLCGRSLRARTGTYGAFYGCSGYPACKHTQEVTESQLTLVAALSGITCDHCGSGPMRPRAQRRDVWLECAAPTTCARRRKLVIVQR